MYVSTVDLNLKYRRRKNNKRKYRIRNVLYSDTDILRGFLNNPLFK